MILIATGSEVGLIVAAQQQLQEEHLSVRLVSMPCWELFEAQSSDYRDLVLPPSVRARLAVEAGVTQGWHRYVGDQGDVIGVDRFGASAPGPVVMREYGFTVEQVCRTSSGAAGTGPCLNPSQARITPERIGSVVAREEMDRAAWPWGYGKSG